MRTPKTRKRPAARKLVKRFGMRVGTAWPRIAERIDMTMREPRAAEKTRKRGCFIAMRAAMRKVLSPISEKMIMMKERRKEWKG